MKKLFFIAALGVAGIMSAMNSTESVTSNVQDLKLNNGPRTFVVYTSCGVAATTTQDWTDEQAQAWGDRVQAINCPSLNQLINFDDGIDFNGPM